MNHVIAVFKNQGVAAGLKKLADVIESGAETAYTGVVTTFESLETQFPVLGTFLGQFASDFGKKMLADAAPLAAQVKAGSMTMLNAAEKLAVDAINDGWQIAKTDATQVGLNALRVYLPVPTTDSVVAPVGDDTDSDSASGATAAAAGTVANPPA